LKTSSQPLHPVFKFNGLHYNKMELLDFAKSLVKEGAPHEIDIGKFIQKWFDDTETITVTTSGSTGIPKSITIRKEFMVNSANATGMFFKLGSGTSALLCLPPKYIAGKMMLVRAMILGWDLHVVAPEKDALTQYDNKYDFAAMVPYQVHHSIHALEKVGKLIIGGGDISNELNEKLQKVFTEAFATYGMTETVTHIAVKRINGLAKSEEFTALPNVKLSQDERGCLEIDAPNISGSRVITNDIVKLTSETTFKWLGRYDNIINSGGIKMNPEQIEEKLAPHIDLPFIISSEKDNELGERIIIIVENKDKIELPNYAEVFLNLESYERPKRIYSFSKFPYTETEKIKRKEILKSISKYKK
jgi:O-succinylbenzoic acid--CoA ligase